MFFPPPEVNENDPQGSDTAYAYAAELLQNGCTAAEVRDQLVIFGLTKQAATAVAAHGYGSLLLQGGMSSADARKKLMGFGLNKEAATVLIAELLNPTVPPVSESNTADGDAPTLAELEKRMMREAGMKNMAIGGMIAILGGAFTIASYWLALQGGVGAYVVAWGAILFGALMFLKGAAQASA
jgi:hypothetical protein